MRKSTIAGRRKGMPFVCQLQQCRCRCWIQLFHQHIDLTAETHPKAIGRINGERTLVIASMDWAIGPDPISLPLGIRKIRLREKDNPLATAGDCPGWEGWWTGLKHVDGHRASISFR